MANENLRMSAVRPAELRVREGAVMRYYSQKDHQLLGRVAAGGERVADRQARAQKTVSSRAAGQDRRLRKPGACPTEPMHRTQRRQTAISREAPSRRCCIRRCRLTSASFERGPMSTEVCRSSSQPPCRAEPSPTPGRRMRSMLSENASIPSPCKVRDSSRKSCSSSLSGS